MAVFSQVYTKHINAPSGQKVQFFKVQEDCLNLEDGTDRLSRNVGN
jgi:hypothetical protein